MLQRVLILYYHGKNDRNVSTKKYPRTCVRHSEKFKSGESPGKSLETICKKSTNLQSKLHRISVDITESERSVLTVNRDPASIPDQEQLRLRVAVRSCAILKCE